MPISRSAWEAVTSYPSELAGAVKQAREGVAKKEAAEKAKQYQSQAEKGLASKKPEAPKQEAAPKKEYVTLGSTIEKVKARNKMLSDL